MNTIVQRHSFIGEMEHFLHRQVSFHCMLAPYISIILIFNRGYESTKCHIHSQTEDYGLLRCDVYQTTRCHNAEEHNIQSRRRWGGSNTKTQHYLHYTNWQPP
jgi:ferric iron reductase protein FhuF